jgi:hypothetical protein
MGLSGKPFQDHGHAHAAADAHGLDAPRLVEGLQAVNEGAGDLGTRGAEGVAEGDRAAVGR